MIYLELFLGFLKVGLFTFGGGYAAIPIIRETVLAHSWLSDDTLSTLIAVSESTPGPIMVNLATFVGARKAGVLGAICATFAVILPAFVVILLLMKLLKNAMKNPAVKAAVNNMKPCVTGMIMATGVFMAAKNILPDAPAVDIVALVLTAVLAFIYFGSKKAFKKGMSPILLILLAGATGVAIYGI